MTSKQRAYLKGLAMTMEPILQVGKSSITPEHTAAVAEALEARELIKINVRTAGTGTYRCSSGAF